MPNFRLSTGACLSCVSYSKVISIIFDIVLHGPSKSCLDVRFLNRYRNKLTKRLIKFYAKETPAFCKLLPKYLGKTRLSLLSDIFFRALG